MSVEGNGDRAIRRRVRTGCLKCRSRRRKCDERKPICSNCAERNFECNYGLQLRFPDSNARTVAHVGAASTPRYTHVRFANDAEAEGSRRHANDRRRRSSEISHADSVLHQPQEHQNAASQDSKLLPYSPYQDAVFPVHSAAETSHRQAAASHRGPVLSSTPKNILDTAQPEAGHTEVFQTSPMGRVQAGSAEHGAIESLVSMATMQPFVPDDDIDDVAMPSASHLWQEAGMSSHGTNGTGPRQSELTSSNEISEERILTLLRYYRYHVAPWLEVCDLDQHLGIHLPIIAADSQFTLYALLAFTARHQELVAKVPEQAQVESTKYSRLSKHPSNSFASPRVQDPLEARVLRLMVDLISSPLGTWSNQFNSRQNLLARLYPHALEVSLAASLFWCCFRFDLAAALVNETPTAVDLARCLPHEANLDDSLGFFVSHGGVDQQARYALFLCAKAIRTFNEQQSEIFDDRAGRGEPRNRTGQWQLRWSELSAWYANRHKFTNPLLELAASTDRAFPTVIFTTVTATLANMLYHTAAITLLDCKPRTIQLQAQRSPAASPHWHAQRICAIAVSHASFEIWDPCLVACILLAARKMTHQEQQITILGTLQRARDATGWKIDEKLRKLQEFWRLAEHV